MRKSIAFVLMLSAMLFSLPSNAGDANHPTAAIGASGDVRKLPLFEVPAAGRGDTLALLITGDGGWAELDQHVSAELAHRGMPVVGLSSLKYFWHARPPELATLDVANVLRHYLKTWHCSHIALVGYSFGADVLPFIVRRLPPDLRARLISVNLLGLSASATFEVSVGDWVHAGSPPSRPVAPELARIANVPVLCVYGEGEQESLCPSITQRNVTSVRIGQGHHFSGNYGAIAQEIWKGIADSQNARLRLRN